MYFCNYLRQSQFLLRGPLDDHGDHSEIWVRWFWIPLIVLLLPIAAPALLPFLAPWVPAGSFLFKGGILVSGVWWACWCGFIHEACGTGEMFWARYGLIQTRRLLRNHLSRVVRPVVGWIGPRYTAGGKTLLRISVEVKLMVVEFSDVGECGCCQEALLRPVLCHADQPVGRSATHVRTGERRGGGRSKSRSLTSGRLLAPSWLYLKSKQLTVSCKSRCVIEGRMTRYLRAEWLIAPGVGGLGRVSVQGMGREEDSKPVNNP